MEDYPKYTKRQFLKLLGLGIAFLPIISCFESNEESTKSDNDSTEEEPTKEEEISSNDLQLLQRNDSAYETYNQGFNKRLHYLPKYIALCFTEKGVQHAVRLAKKKGLPIAVKSGGHSFEGFSTNDGGMVINVSQMKAITWLSDSEIAVQPGVLLQELNAELLPKNKLLPAGSCGTVAIAGLTLGGGYGFFSRKYGLTCDCLQEIQIVTADEQIHSTNEDEQLLWACKGGGNGNFGVVTSFRFQLFEAPKSFSALTLKFRNLDSTSFSTILQLWFKQTAELDKESFSAFVLNGKTLTVLATSYGNLSALEASIAPLIERADNVNRKVQQDLATALKRYYGRKGPIYFKNASAGLYRQEQDLAGLEASIFELVTSNPGIIFQINTLGEDINDPSFERKSAYPHRSYSYLGELQAYWEEEKRESILLAAFAKIQEVLKGIKAHYRNYPDINFTDWESAYYGQSYQLLQEVKTRYDPGNLFRYAQSVRPKA